MDIKMKKAYICHVLSKRSLMTTDTFLFDVGKANADDEVGFQAEHFKTKSCLQKKNG